MKKIGLIVNPIAGMGGPLGYKGSDDVDLIRKEAKNRGLRPISPKRASDMLKRILNQEKLTLMVPRGIMGEIPARTAGFKGKISVLEIPTVENTSREDTRACVRELLRRSIDALVFVGGDGTARDIYDVIGDSLPVLGVPSGVKIFSSVFACTPEEAGLIITEFLEDRTQIIYGEVLDIDEELYRKGVLSVRLYGVMRVLSSGNMIQGSKSPSSSDEEADMRAIAKYFKEEFFDKNTIYILGPGTTVSVIARELGVDKTLLGVDVLLDGRLVGRDVDRETLSKIVSEYNLPVKLVLSPIGGSGFLLGRGNQQIGPEVLRRVTLKDLIVVATPRKLSKIRELRVDLGEQLNRRFRGYIRVLVGYREEKMMRIR